MKLTANGSNVVCGACEKDDFQLAPSRLDAANRHLEPITFGVICTVCGAFMNVVSSELAEKHRDVNGTTDAYES